MADQNLRSKNVIKRDSTRIVCFESEISANARIVLKSITTHAIIRISVTETYTFGV